MGMFVVCAVCAGMHGCARVCVGVQGGARGARCGQVWPSVHR